MPVETASLGLVRGTTDSYRKVGVNNQGQQLVGKLLPDYAQLCAEGRIWRAQEASATASVTALPTTASLFTLVNNESDDGSWYVILAVYAFNSANAAAIDAFGLAACISMQQAVTGGVDVTVARDIASTSIKPMLGGYGAASPYQGRAIIDTGVTITDDLWFPIGPSSGSTGVASATGSTLWFPVNGLIVLKPKSLMGLVSTATSTSNTTRKGVVWCEVPRSWLVSA